MSTPLLLPTHQSLTWLAPIEELSRFRKPDDDWADTDAAWVYRYLCNGCGSPMTRKAVQGEMLRLAYFMRKTGVMSLSALSSDNAVGYRDWLASTKNANEISAKPIPRVVNGHFNPDWRPFRSAEPLSASAVKTALRLVSGCLAFLQDDPHCAVQGNPFRRVAKQLEQRKRAVADIDDDSVLHTKALSPHALQALFHYLASEHFRGSERSRVAKHWLLLLMSRTAVRVSTLVHLSTDNLFPDPAHSGQWRLRFRAKHNSRVDQPWSSELNQAFQNYCRTIELPENRPSTPLWLGAKSNMDFQPVKASSVWAMIKTLGRQAEHWATHEDEVPTEMQAQWTTHDSQQLLALHPHTLRHTWCTHAVNIQKMALLQAKQHMGHSSVTVTERYVWMGNGSSDNGEQ